MLGLTPTTAPTTASAVAAVAAAAGTVAGIVRPGFALDGEPDIVFATAAGRDQANNPNSFFDTQWGDGSRNVRVNLARSLGQQLHIYVEDMQVALLFRFQQGGFGEWDDMYHNYTNDPGSFTSVLTAYNQANPTRQIVPRW